VSEVAVFELSTLNYQREITGQDGIDLLLETIWVQFLKRQWVEILCCCASTSFARVVLVPVFHRELLYITCFAAAAPLAEFISWKSMVLQT